MATRSLNKAQIIGNLTRDPELRYTANGAAVCTFGVATNRSWKDASGDVKEEAEFHNIVAWNKLAEICSQILAKGMKIYIEGELKTRDWEDENGVRHYKTEIKVGDMILLDSKGKSGVGVDAATVDDSNAPTDDSDSDSADDEKKDDKKKKEKKEEEEEEEVSEDDLPF